MRFGVALVVVLVAAGCKHDQHFTDAGPPPDAHTIDGGVTPIDAGPDAAPPAPGREITGGAGRVNSAGYVLDVQVGHGLSQQPAQSASTRVEGNAPVKP